MRALEIFNRITRTRKTISRADLDIFRRQISITKAADGRYFVRFPHDSNIDPYRKFKEIARYLLISQLLVGDSVLDIGSGSFYGARILAEKAKKVVGVEASLTAVMQARLTWLTVGNLRCLHGKDLSKVVGDFSSATIINVIEHMPRDIAKRLLTEIGSHLQQNGTLILSTPRNRQKITHQPENPDHVQEYSEEGLERLISECGFKIETRYIQNMNGIKPGRESDVKSDERAWFLWVLRKG